MATISWDNGAGGDWGLYLNWSPNTVPGAPDDVLIDLVSGTPYDVTINSAEAALSLTLDSADATVQLNNSLTLGSTPTLNAGTIAGALSGGVFKGIGLAATYYFNGSVLTLYNDGGTVTGQVALSTPVASPHFALSADASLGTLIGLAAPGTYANGIVLSNPLTDNPTTIPSYGYVKNESTSYNGDAVYGTTAAAWTITNYGTINGTQQVGASGIHLTAGGLVINDAAAHIYGDAYGVVITGAAGTVINLGTIAAASYGGSTGIWLVFGGRVVNGDFGTPSALISGDADGLVIGNYGVGAGTVANYGTIVGPNLGVRLAGGGSLLNFGTIASLGAYGDGVSVESAAGTVVNAGVIDANNLGVWLRAGGTVANSGSIAGDALGVYIEGGAGTVVNDGTVSATGGSGIGVALGTGGVVRNNPGGLIEGYKFGVELFGTPGTVVNDATIVVTGSLSYQTGVFLRDGGLVLNGLIDSSALIAGAYNGVWARDAAGTVVNYGTIAGTDGGGNGVWLYHGGSITNGAAGYPLALIAGDGRGIRVDGTVGNVANFGTVLASGAGSTAGIVLNAGGSVSNADGAYIGGGAGVAIHGGGTVANLGTIIGTAAGSGPGIYLNGGGTIVNGASAVTDAVIVGVHSAITVYNDPGTVINYGTLAASVVYTPAVYLHAGGSVTNQSSGLIQGGGFGVMIGGGTGLVTNSGTIDGIYGTGVRMDVGLATILNGTSGAGAATIFGGQVGVALNSGGTVVNGFSGATAAVIEGGYYGIKASYAAATVTNFGTVAGTNAAGVFLYEGGAVSNAAGALIAGLSGIEIFNATGAVDNAGVVQAVNLAVYLAAGGTVVNRLTGTIAGGDGIRLLGAGSVVNYGTVIGNGASGFAVALTPGASLTNGAGMATGASIVGTLAGVIVYGGAGDVTNFGTIGATVGYASAIQFNLGGSVTNQASGVIAGGGQGIFIDGAAGTVTNLGSIYGVSGHGVVLGAGGTVRVGSSEAPGGSILGYDTGVELFGAPGTVLNYGTIAGTNYAGIRAFDGAFVANSGLIAGAYYGADLAGAPTTVVNTGTILGTNAGSTGLRLADGGLVQNSGTIAGSRLGIFLDSAATVVNHGTITGYTTSLVGPNGSTVINDGVIASPGGYGAGVIMYGGAGGVVVNYGTIAATGYSVGVYISGGSAALTNAGTIIAGSVGIVMRGGAETVVNAGTVAGGTAAVLFGSGDDRLIVNTGGVFGGLVDGNLGSDAIELAGDGTLDGFGTDFIGFEQIVVDVGADWQLTATTPLGAGISVVDAGSLTFVGSLTNNGSISIQASATLEFTDAVGGGGSIDFAGAGGTLAIGGATLTNTISGFDPGDAIDLTSFGGATGATLGANNLLTVTNGGATFTVQFDPSDDFSGQLFQLADDGAGGTLISVAGPFVLSGQTVFVSSGQTASGFSVLGGGTLVVLSGGTASSTADSGTEIVSAGGRDVAATIGNLGLQDVFGVASATTVASGGSQIVEAGGVVSGATVSLGGLQSVLAGGAASGVMLAAGSGGAVGGIQLVSGSATATTINSSAVERVLSGGVDVGATVNSGGLQSVETGATAIGVVVFAGGTQTLGGTAAATASGTVLSGGGQVVGSGGIAIGTTVVGGIQVVFAGGAAFATTMTDGGFEIVSAGGTMTGTTVSGGTLELADGAIAGGTIALDGVGDVLQIDGTTTPAAVIAGFDSDDSIDLRGVAFVSGGSATLGAGNLLTVHMGGVTFELQLDQTQDFTGQTFGVVDDGFGGTRVLVFVPGIVGSGQTLTVSSGQTLSDITVQSGGTLIVDAGGTVISAHIEGGGSETINAGGLDVGALVESGGYQDVFGTTSGTVIIAGGSQTVEVGGDAEGTVLDDAAIQDVFGFAGGTVISASDIQQVESGGVASGTFISSGGLELVFGGGLTIDTTIDGGGRLDLSDGALTSGTIAFAGAGGVLQIDGTDLPDVPVVGFERGDRIDLRRLTPSGANSVVFDPFTGTLTVSGSFVDSMHLDGVAAGAVFTLVDDGAGGTFVLETAPAPTGLALLSDSGIAGDGITNDATPTISGTGEAGDTVTLFDGGAVVATGTVAGNGSWVVFTGALADGGHNLFAMQTDVFGDVSAPSAVLPVTIDTTAPTVQLRVLAVDQNSGPTPIGIAAPSDLLTSADSLTISVTGLPSDGIVVLADGVTPLSIGQTLTIAELTGLQFIPTAGLIGQTSRFSYTVTDIAGNAAFGSAALGINLISTGPDLINGLGGVEGFGENVLPPNDDEFTNAIDITAVFGGGLNFFGTSYDHLFVNNNGNITFNSGLSTFTPDEITAGINNPIIAPFWADVDTRGGPTVPTGGNATGSNTVYYDLDTVNHVLTVTWNDVGYFSSHTDKANAFQLQLIDRGGGNFDIVFRYQAIYWTTGDVTGSGGLGEDGAARAGYSAGDGIHAFELPQSGDQNAMLGLPFTPAPDGTQGVTGETGVYLFQVRNGVVVPPPPTNLALSPASDSGVVGDNVTNVVNPIITGLGLAGNTVTLFDGDTVVGTTVVNADGTWAVTTSALTNGLHNLTATQTDTLGAISAASAPLALTINAETHLFDFLFTYGDGSDYYFGTVADDGSFGYATGQVLNTLSLFGRYDILGERGTTSQAVGTVVVSTYSHGGTGQASTTPVRTAAGLPSGTQGLGSESDAVLGLDGQLYPFDNSMEASFQTTPVFGFIFTYADGAFYTGTVADDGRFGTGAGNRPVFDASGNFRGVYSIFTAGVGARNPGTVIIDRFVLGGISFMPVHGGLGAVDGTGGLGSETGAIIVNGVAVSFSDLLRPSITLALPSLPATPLPSTADVIAAEVNQIYSDVFGRLPDASGFAAYTAALAGGMSPTELRQLLALSDEGQFRLGQLYRQIFGRDIDQSGQQAYTAALINGSSLGVVQLIIAQSSEAQFRIEEIYQQVLGRSADGSGLAAYMGALANLTAPASLLDVRSIVAHSPEAAGDLAVLVQSVLQRSTFAAELVGMEDALTGGATQQTLQSDLFANGTAGSYGRIVSAAGDEVLTPPAATPILFDFTDINFGQDTVVGFDPVRHTIELSQSLVADFATLQTHMLSFAGGTAINLDPAHVIQLQGIAPDRLGAANFRFV